MTGQVDVEMRVAEAVVTLMQHGLIERSDLTLAKIRDLLGLDRRLLGRAATRRRTVGWRPLPEDLRPVEPVEPAEPFERPRRRPSRQRARRVIGGVVELRCSGGVVDEPHWAPEETFDLRTDRAGQRRSRCRPHYLETQRARRLSTDVVEAFDRADLDLEYDDEGRPVGVVCAVCGSTLECTCRHQGADADDPRDEAGAGQDRSADVLPRLRPLADVTSSTDPDRTADEHLGRLLEEAS